MMEPVLEVKEAVSLEEEETESGPEKTSTGRVSREDGSGGRDQAGRSTETEKHMGFVRRMDIAGFLRAHHQFPFFR